MLGSHRRCHYSVQKSKLIDDEVRYDSGAVDGAFDVAEQDGHAGLTF